MNQRWLGFTGTVFLALSVAVVGFGCGGSSSSSNSDGSGGIGGDAGTSGDKQATSDGSVDQPTGADSPVDVPPQAALVVTPTNLSITEGQTGTFSVSLSQLVTHAVVVTVSTSDGTVAKPETETFTFDPNNNDPRTITVDGIVDDDTVDNTAILTLSADGITSAMVRVQVKDVNVQELVVMPPTVTMTETKTADISVRLKYRPAAPITVNVGPATPTPKLTVSPSMLTFSPTDYSIEQTVTLTAPKDNDAADDVVRLNVSSANLTTVPVDVTIVDIDKENLDIVAVPQTVREDNQNGVTFYVGLTLPPPGTLAVTVTSSDTTKANVSPATLTFTPDNYNTAQPVVIVPVHDSDTKDDVITITLSASGVDPRVLPLTVKDVDSQQIVVTPDGQTINMDEGGDTQITVHLSAKPGGQVTVSAFPSDGSRLAMNPQVLTFDDSNYFQAQTVNIHANPDSDIVDNTVTITLKSAGANDVTKAVLIKDRDKQAILLQYNGSPGNLLGTESAATATTADTQNMVTVYVQLQFQPLGDVTVTVTSADNTRVTPPATPSLTFTKDNYNVLQALTFTLPHDLDTMNNTVDLTFASPGLDSKDVKVTVTDIDVQNLKITGAPTMPVLEPSCNAQVMPPDCSATTPVSFNVTTLLPLMGTDSIHANVSSSDPSRLIVAGDSQSIMLSSTTPTVTVHLAAAHDADAMPNTVTVTIADAANKIQSQVVTINIADSDAMNIVPTLIGPLDPQDMSRLVVNEAPVMGDNSNVAKFHVQLSADPVNAVSVSMTPLPSVVLVSPSTLTFTPGASGNWSTGIDVTITGIKDVNLVDELVSVRISGPASLGAPDKSVTVRQKDTDTQAIYLSASSTPLNPMNPDTFTFPTKLTLNPPIPEGGMPATFYVSLKWQPASAVTVTVAVPNGVTGSFGVSSGGGLSSSQTILTFSTGNYNTPQQVNVAALVDQNTDTEIADISVSLPAQDSRTVEATTADPDQQKIIIDTTCAASGNCFTLNESKDADIADLKDIHVKLKYPPHQGATVEQVTVTSSNSSAVALAGATPMAVTLAFGNFTGSGGWDTVQTVTVQAREDDDAIDGLSTIALSSSLTGGMWSAPLLSFPVGVNDEDKVGVTVVNPSTNNATATIKESGADVDTMATINVHLTRTPPAGFVVQLGSSDTNHATVSQGQLTFGPGNTDQSFTIIGVSDPSSSVDHTVTATVSSTSPKAGPSFPATIAVTVTNVTPVPDAGVDGSDDSETGAEVGSD
ncbi:MAG TPA: hypothetical protein VMU50_23465 [Polyangia bacterium]|nr:hypothetical protein [Polyangia bacterium]